MLVSAALRYATLPFVRTSNIRAVPVHSDYGPWFPPFDVIHHDVPVRRTGLIYSGQVGLNCVRVRRVGIWGQADIGNGACGVQSASLGGAGFGG